jgi:hypothetical protein
MHFGKKIIRASLVKSHRVLHARATALLDVDAERFAPIFRFLQQRLDFLGCARGNLDNRLGGDAHIHTYLNDNKKLNLDPQRVKYHGRNHRAFLDRPEVFKTAGTSLGRFIRKGKALGRLKESRRSSAALSADPGAL